MFSCAILDLGFLQSVVGQFEEAGNWPQRPGDGSKLVVRCTKCAGTNLESRRSKAKLVWLQAQLVLSTFHSVLLFLYFLGGWESGRDVVGLAHPTKSTAPCLPETDGSPRSISTATPQHLKAPNRSLLPS